LGFAAAQRLSANRMSTAASIYVGCVTPLLPIGCVDNRFHCFMCTYCPSVTPRNVFCFLNSAVLSPYSLFYTHSFISLLLSLLRGTRWAIWLRHCAIRRKVASPIPDGVIGIFHWHNPSGRTAALGSTQPLTEISKSKAIPLQAWIGPECSSRLRFPDFKTIGT